ncbi:SHOCT domain-containing protein [Salinigranum halophilum]|jgi:uncharacterized membrane protein|uniref:SHOCT domain-containing protein n=1 Tax=Salinigranum halophilum TaxID=2565931 RepID=UPI001F390F3E|nr:SHOCT domain-containing protein [Salinigranum halophilum]
MRTTPTADGCSLRSGRGRTTVVSGLTTLVILAVAFGAMALGVPYFWVVFPVGFGGVLPLVVAHSLRTDRASGGSPTAHPDSASGGHDTRDEALRTLRTRYAHGDLTDEAFERRLEKLLQTETVADAADWARGGTRDTDSDGGPSGGD